MNYSREARCLLGYAAYIVERIIFCYEQRYGNLFDDQKRLMWVSVPMREIAFYVMLFVILIATSGEALAARSPKKMLTSGIFHFSIFQIFNRYQEKEILDPITQDEINEIFSSIVWYGLKYFNLINVGSLKLWPKILRLQDENL